MHPSSSTNLFCTSGPESYKKGDANNLFFLNRFNDPLGEPEVQKMLRKYIKGLELGEQAFIL